MRFVLALAALLIIAAPAQAEVVSASPAAFEIRRTAEIAAPAARVWRDLVQVGRWWSDAHTYSGHADRMRLFPRAGGCWCETWGRGNSVEHGRVILAMPNETLRVAGALGPLQEMGVSGTLTFSLAEANGRTRLTLTYRVLGTVESGLESIAPLVDQVLAQQFARLVRLAQSGAPE